MRFTLVLSGFLYLSVLAAAAMQPAPAKSGRFDLEVRADFFAAFSGDMTRFERGMARCEEVLAADPNHAEAMVWHGSGVFFRAGLAFQKGDFQNGMALYQKGLAEMQRAVEIAPDNVGVRIPRGAVLLEATRQMPEPQAKALVQIGVSDFEHTLKLQELVLRDPVGSRERRAAVRAGGWLGAFWRQAEGDAVLHAADQGRDGFRTRHLCESLARRHAAGESRTLRRLSLTHMIGP